MSKKNKKRVDLDTRPDPNPLFRNYDYGGPENGGETGPGTGLYHGNMNKYKSVKDFLEKARKRRARKRKMAFLSLAGDVIDFKKKLQEKQEQEAQEESKENLNSIEELSPEIPGMTDLERAKSRKELSELQAQTGVWPHRFSQVRKDKEGFFILKSDNAAGVKIRPGDLLADEAINMTPYWKVTSVKGDRISLQAIAPNPFVTGVGAGGAKILPQDIDVFTGEYEKKKLKYIQEKMDAGTATIDDIKYLLLGTVPVNFGPNGPQGGWYNVNDTRSNRAYSKGLNNPEEIMMADAKFLKEYGFPVPVSALQGILDPTDWNNWVDGSAGGVSDRDYVPKDINKYIDFRRKMTEKGRWRYDESSLAELRRRFDPEALKQHWENIIADFTTMSKEEFTAKHKYLPDTLSGLIQRYNDDLARQEKERNKASQLLSDQEDNSIESILKNIFHPERRVSIRNIINLIELSQEDPAYEKYLKDFVALGGSNDYFANEKVINYFDMMEDVETLKLASQKLKLADNQKRILHALLRHGQQEYVLDYLDKTEDIDFESLSSLMYEIGNRTKDKGGRSQYVIDYAKKHNLIEKIKKVLSSDSVQRYFADELIHHILIRFGPTMDWQPGDEEFVKNLQELSKKLNEKNR